MRFDRWVLGISVLCAGPAQALLLGGVEVPKEKVVVYLMIGHSNMSGIDTRNSDGVAHARCWNYTWSAATKAWVPAKETPGALRNGLSTRGIGGPSMPFLKQMAAAYPEYHFGVVTNASLSSTCKGENTGNNGSGMDPEDNRYWKGARLYNEIVTAAKAIQADVTLGGIVCMLGTVEATRTTEAVCRSFSDDIAQLAKDIRADLNAPRLPFIMGEYETGSTGEFRTTLPLPALVLEESRLVPAKLEHAVTIDSKGIAMLDDHHYTANVGQGEFAKRTLAAIQAKKWFPPPGGASISARPIAAGPGAVTGSRLLFPEYGGPFLAVRDGNLFQMNGRSQNLVRSHAISSH